MRASAMKIRVVVVVNQLPRLKAVVWLERAPSGITETVRSTGLLTLKERSDNAVVPLLKIP